MSVESEIGIQLHRALLQLTISSLRILFAMISESKNGSLSDWTSYTSAHIIKSTGVTRNRPHGKPFVRQAWWVNGLSFMRARCSPSFGSAYIARLADLFVMNAWPGTRWCEVSTQSFGYFCFYMGDRDELNNSTGSPFFFSKAAQEIDDFQIKIAIDSQTKFK
jgi:hypothetical protein